MKAAAIGIDPSFTGTGIVAIDQKGGMIRKRIISTESKQPTESRILKIANKVDDFLDWATGNPLIAIEGLAYTQKSSFAHQLGALHYYLRIKMYEGKFRYKIVTPSELKKFVTGKGNSGKDVMLLKTYKKWGIEFTNDNLCDAYCLARFGLANAK